MTIKVFFEEGLQARGGRYMEIDQKMQKMLLYGFLVVFLKQFSYFVFFF